MYDGTWAKGLHWFSPPGLGPRFKRAALLRWLEGSEPRAADPRHGLAYSVDIPPPHRGRPRRVDGGAKPAVHGA
jgi:hypothetical protein